MWRPRTGHPGAKVAAPDHAPDGAAVDAARNVFSPRVVVWLIGVGVLGFLALAAHLLLEDEPQHWATIGPTSYSFSAIGHRAWYEALGDDGLVVRRSRFAPVRLARAGVLVAAQPLIGRDTIRPLLNANRLLVVLPKWRGRPASDHPGHVAAVWPIPVPALSDLLEDLSGDRAADLVRHDAAVTWRESRLGGPPTLQQPHLFRAEGFRPLLATTDGWMLIGERRRHGRVLVIVSDPDLINNAGIGLAGNAALGRALIADMLSDGDPAATGGTGIDNLLAGGLPGGDGTGPVIFDETIHGLERAPTLAREALRMPFLIGTLLAAAALAMLFWAAAGRFGQPVPPPRLLAAGKAVLIGNMANLLLSAGHHGMILDRYRRDILREVAAACHLPPRLTDAERVQHLDTLAAARGIRAMPAPAIDDTDTAPVPPGDSRRRAAPRTWRSALRLHRWKQEMLHGTGRRPRSG